jgi:parvulin-like peptidyl-prolyl isomerase
MALVVNGERIEDSVIVEEMERLRADYERVFADKDKKEREDQLREWSRENVIERALISQHARTSGPEIEGKEIDAAIEDMKKQYESRGQSLKEMEDDEKGKLREAIEVQIRTERLLREVTKDVAEPSEDEVKKYYEENKERFRTPERLRVAHIVKHPPAGDFEAAQKQMLEARRQIDEGKPFEMLVTKYSDCPDNGGDLGYIVRGQMVEEFEDVVFNMGVGDVSDVFQTRFGFHIAKLYDRRPSDIRPLKDVKDAIAGELKNQMQREAVENFVDKLKVTATIEDTK